jgi:prepilin-type N-terminal cleavage/methylation domain-containing protein
MMMRSAKRDTQKGFTIVELLFASTIFSLVLLGAAAGLIQVGRIYYRGVITSRTQDVARSVIDDVAQTLQFNAGTVRTSTSGGNTTAFCVGGTRYNVNLDNQIVSDGDWALVRDTTSAECTQNDTSSGTELLGESMRLHAFSVSQIGDSNAYRIQIRVIYGDDELLDGLDTDNPACRGLRFGGQFCAVSELNTIVSRRIAN